MEDCLLYMVAPCSTDSKGSRAPFVLFAHAQDLTFLHLPVPRKPSEQRPGWHRMAQKLPIPVLG